MFCRLTTINKDLGGHVFNNQFSSFSCDKSPLTQVFGPLFDAYYLGAVNRYGILSLITFYCFISDC